MQRQATSVLDFHANHCILLLYGLETLYIEEMKSSLRADGKVALDEASAPKIQPKLYRRPVEAPCSPASTAKARTSPNITPEPVKQTPPPAPKEEPAEQSFHLPAVPVKGSYFEPVEFFASPAWQWNGRFALAALVIVGLINLACFWVLHETPTQGKMPLYIEQSVADLPYSSDRVIEYRRVYP